MAGETGLEPAAFCVTGRRYNQLNYSPGVVKCSVNIKIARVVVKLYSLKKLFYMARKTLF